MSGVGIEALKGQRERDREGTEDCEERTDERGGESREIDGENGEGVWREQRREGRTERRAGQRETGKANGCSFKAQKSIC